MRRHLNYTGRTRLPVSALSVKLTRSDELAFDADLKLPEGHDADLRVFLEAYYKRSFMRFDYGNVGAIQEPLDRRLTELESTERVFFRLKLVDPTGEHGRIAALLDSVAVSVADEEDKGGRKSILPVNFRNDMGELVWAISVEDATGPELHINADIPGVRDWVRTDRVFSSLVYPAIVGDVLLHMIADPMALASADSGWQYDWMTFVKDVTRVPIPATDDQVQLMDWREEVVREFARAQRSKSRLVEELQGRMTNAD